MAVKMKPGGGSGYSPACSVLVCTRNRPQQLDRCLATLANLDYPDYQVVVVDNAPSDQCSRQVALKRGVRYLIEPAPGLSRARNRGARACETDIVAFLDDDAVPQPDWLSVLAQDFEDPRTMAVTGAILPLLTDEETRLRCEEEPVGRSERLVVDRETPGWFEISNFGGIGDGSNMAFRRSAFDTWPGFDENLGRGSALNGGEEHYAFFTLVERGYRVIRNPGAIVRHPFATAMQDVRARHLNLLATATAYITRLAVEHPSCRGALARYLIDRLRGTSRPWRQGPARAAGRIAPRRLTLLSMLSGPWIYLRSRRDARNRRNQQETSAENPRGPSIPGGWPAFPPNHASKKASSYN